MRAQAQSAEPRNPSYWRTSMSSVISAHLVGLGADERVREVLQLVVDQLAAERSSRARPPSSPDHTSAGRGCVRRQRRRPKKPSRENAGQASQSASAHQGRSKRRESSW